MYFCWTARHYLLGKFFTLETDNANNVRWVLNWDKGGRLQRWSCIMQMFWFRLVHKSSKSPSMMISDNLSRLPRLSASVVVNPRQLPSLTELKEMQEADPFLCRVIQRVKGFPENSRDVAELFAYGGTFCIAPSTGLLLFRDKKGAEKIVAPRKARFRIFNHFHNLVAHMSRDKTYDLCSSKFWWRGMYGDIRDFVRHCISCQECRPHSPTRAGELQQFPATRPWQVVHLDLIGPFTKTKNNNRFALVCVDRFTRYLILVALPTMDSETVTTAFFRHVVCKFGHPETVLTDLGGCFISEHTKLLFSEKFLNIKGLRTTAYRPQTNSRNERTHTMINLALRIWTNPECNDFDEYLDAIAWAHNISISTGTSFSPFFLNFL